MISGCSTSSTGSTGRGHTIGHYRVIRTLGSGTYGKVKLGEEVNTGEKVSFLRPIRLESSFSRVFPSLFPDFSFCFLSGRFEDDREVEHQE